MRALLVALLLVALALPVAGKPLAPARAPATWPALDPAEPLPFPAAGDVSYYVGEHRYGQGDVYRFQQAVRVSGPLSVLDRTGATRQAYVVETVYGEPHGDLDALLDDPDADRSFVVAELATREVVRVGSDGSGSFEGGGFPFEAGPLRHRWGYAHHFEAWPDPGLRDAFGTLWGTALGDGFELAWRAGGESDGMGWGGTHQALEYLGLGGEVLDLRLTAGPPHDYTGTFERVGEARFLAAYTLPSREGPGADVEHELAFAAAPLPVLERIRWAYEGDHAEMERRLVEFHPGPAALRWDAPGASAADLPALGPLGADGPADGDLGLAYPLRDAVAAVRGDLTLVGLQAMAARGEPVLVHAFHEVRPGDVAAPVPEARWRLVFHDAGGDAVVVETRRPLGAPLPVSREQLPPAVAWPEPPIGAVSPKELPAEAPTLAQAAEAWSALLPDRDGEVPDTFVYALQRQHDDTLRPVVWAGRQEQHDTLFLESASALAFVALDADGGPRLAFASSNLWGFGPAFGLAADLTPAASADAASPEEPRASQREVPAVFAPPALAGAALLRRRLRSLAAGERDQAN